jgi:hypothetical protein
MKLEAQRTWMAALLVVCVAGCTEDVSHDSVDGTDRVAGDGEISGTPTKGGEGESAANTAAPGASDGAGRPGATAPSGGDGAIAAGVLTAGTWDDNRNFDLFLNYKSKVASSGQAGSCRSRSRRTRRRARPPKKAVASFQYLALHLETLHALAKLQELAPRIFAPVEQHEPVPSDDRRWSGPRAACGVARISTLRDVESVTIAGEGLGARVARDADAAPAAEQRLGLIDVALRAALEHEEQNAARDGARGERAHGHDLPGRPR